MDITEFLTARYDEDEGVARAVDVDDDPSDGRWRVEEASDYTGIREWRVGADVSWGFSWAARTYDEVAAAYIVTWDPARALADLTAKRAIVAEYRTHAEHRQRYGDKETDYSWGARTKLDWICKLLAAPYAEHPDYDLAWRIDG